MAKTFTQFSRQLNEFRELAGKSIGSIAAAVGRGVGKGALSLAATAGRGLASKIGIDTSAVETAFGAGKRSAERRLSDEDKFIDMQTACKVDGRMINANVAAAQRKYDTLKSKSSATPTQLDVAQEELNSALRQKELFDIKCNAIKSSGGNAVRAMTLIKKAEAEFARKP